MKDETTEDAMECVSEALKLARKHKLETELVTYALLAMKETPSLSIGEALEHGKKEWDL